MRPDPGTKAPASTEADDATRARHDEDLEREVARLRRADIDRLRRQTVTREPELFASYQNRDDVIDWRHGAPRWLLVGLVGVLGAALLTVGVWYIGGLERHKDAAAGGFRRLDTVERDLSDLKTDVNAVKNTQRDQTAVLRSIEWQIVDVAVWQAEQAGEHDRARRLRKRFRAIAGVAAEDDDAAAPASAGSPPAGPPSTGSR